MTTTSQEFMGLGRNALIAKLEIFIEANNTTIRERDAARAEAKVLLTSLGEVQTRCTELLNADRLARFLEDKPQTMAALLELAWSIERVRLLHPEGCSYMALADETGEAGRALAREDEKRFRSELLDTAVVAIRLWLGEYDERLMPREPFAAARVMSNSAEGGIDG